MSLAVGEAQLVVAELIHVTFVDAPGLDRAFGLLVREPLAEGWPAMAATTVSGHLRGELEYAADGHVTGLKRLDLYSGTVTLEVRWTRHMLIRAETRLDMADQALLPARIGELEKGQVTSLLGVVGTTH